MAWALVWKKVNFEPQQSDASTGHQQGKKEKKSEGEKKEKEKKKKRKKKRKKNRNKKVFHH